MKFKQLVESVYLNEDLTRLQLKPDEIKKYLYDAPEGMFSSLDKGVVGIFTLAKFVDSKIPKNLSQTMTNFLKSKPFKKFSWKQAEVIFKAAGGTRYPHTRDHIIEDIKDAIKRKSSSVYEEKNGGYFPAVVQIKYNPEEEYLSIGYYFFGDEAFLKGRKIYTVYVPQEELEKGLGIKLRDDLKYLKTGDVVFISGTAGDPPEYEDAVWLKVNEIKGNKVDFIILDTDIEKVQKPFICHGGIFPRQKIVKGSGSKHIELELKGIKFFDLVPSSLAKIWPLLPGCHKVHYELNPKIKRTDYGNFVKLSRGALSVSDYYAATGSGGWTGD
jgi:hypothetical protein